MVELLKYSSNDDSELNNARRDLWSARHMLGLANKEPEKYSKSFWMGRINKERANLRKIAHAVRAKLPPKKLFSVTLAASTMTVETKVRANNRKDALNIARFDYGDSFSVARVEEIK